MIHPWSCYQLERDVMKIIRRGGSYMNVISASVSDFDGVAAGCSCRVLSRRKDSGTGPYQLYQLL
jgi:hypothetical protein